jgi:hypothetical protein
MTRQDLVLTEELVRRFAIRRLANVFHLPETALSYEARFGRDLKATSVSDFKANEFDMIDNDIKDVADRGLLKQMSQGTLVIRTVGDYCDHMVRCSSVNPREVARVLGLNRAGYSGE